MNLISRSGGKKNVLDTDRAYKPEHQWPYFLYCEQDACHNSTEISRQTFSNMATIKQIENQSK
jgi:hypothetical protein